VRAASFALATLVAACATPAPEATTRISVEILSWGYVQERWSVSSTGEASLERVPAGAQLTTPPVAQTFTVTAEDFEQIRAALAPAESLIDNLECNRVIADLPYGAVRWQRADGSEDVIRFDYGCQPNRGLEVFFRSLDAGRNAFREARE
jgi:hypothetical protein